MEQKNIIKNFFNAVKDVNKVDKDKSGGQFNYMDPAEVFAAVGKALDKNGIMYTMSLKINERTGDAMHKIESVTVGKGNQFIVESTFEITFWDKETGEKLVITKAGSGQGRQPGQADGSAESYALRQCFEKNFNIITDKTEDLEIDREYIFDKDGNPVESMSDDSTAVLTEKIFISLGDGAQRNDVIARAQEVIKLLNAELGTKYKQIKTTPDMYAPNMLKIISALKNV